MEIFKLDTEDRTEFGTKYAKILRAAGRYPATLVGEGKETVQFSISSSDFDATVRKGARSYELTIAGSTEKVAIQAANFDSLGDSIQQLDFIRDASGEKAIARATKFADKGYEPDED
ncbi:MAG: ribosomal protein L25 (general stress protein Ctc) [Myxococcota bacterium]|jgi:ribosomal protein L25 (general stress protein Ctc)